MIIIKIRSENCEYVLIKYCKNKKLNVQYQILFNFLYDKLLRTFVETRYFLFRDDKYII